MSIAEWVQFGVTKVLSWPAVALIAIAVFRTQIIDLLRRLKSVSAKGADFAETAASRQPEGAPAPGRTLQQIQADNVGLSPLVTEQEGRIRSELESLRVSQPDQVRLLTRNLALAQLTARAEFTYRTIFGSQIALLRFLASTGPASKARLAPFYEDAKTRFPEAYATYPFDQYLRYLLDPLGLVREEERDRFVITAAGREFLGWLASNGLPENKGL